MDDLRTQGYGENHFLPFLNLVKYQKKSKKNLNREDGKEKKNLKYI